MAFHEEVANRAVDAAAMREEFASRYEDLPFRPHLRQVYADYLDGLAESDGASLVFCTAGKDRTGFIVAVLQTLLGLHPDDVMGEYLLTNAAPDSDAQIEKLRGQIEDMDYFNEIGLDLANSRDWPAWSATSEFGPERAKSASARR